MAFTNCKIQNISGETIVLNGQTLVDGEIHQISDLVRIDWSHDEDVISAIVHGTAVIRDGEGVINGIANQLEYLMMI